MTWIDEWTEQVETGGYLQSLACRTYELHSVGKEWGMEVTDVTFVETASQLVLVISELHPMLDKDVAGTAD